MEEAPVTDVACAATPVRDGRVPDSIDVVKVRAYLTSVPGVQEVHDLHVWGMDRSETALTAHLVFPAGFPGDARVRELCTELREHFSIAQATIQET